MEIKYILKNSLGIKRSEDYFKLSHPPFNTCSFINELKKELKNKNVDVSCFFEILEDFRASCDSIRKETIMAKDNLWNHLDCIFELNLDNKKVSINEEEVNCFLLLNLEPYTEADSTKIDCEISKLKIAKKISELDEKECIKIRDNIFFLDGWRKEYFDLINEDKKKILNKVKDDLVKIGFVFNILETE